MFKIFNKRKRYVVAIITKKDIDYVETIATNRYSYRSFIKM